jgi:hypothetical protein
MQVTDQVVWDGLDFAIFGAMLFGVGIIYELAARKTDSTSYRSAIAVALVAAFILIGVTGAVGIIGTEHDDANLMYGGVLAVGITGALIARGQPHGMVRALLATAFVQVLVAVIALVGGFGSAGPIWPLDVLIMTGFFTSLWLLSAWLFRKTAASHDFLNSGIVKTDS